MKYITAYYTNLGIDLNDLDHPISKLIHEHPSKTHVQQQSIKLQLKSLGLALMDIREYSKSVYKKYAGRIKKTKNESIYGHIFEIMQCAHFIQMSKNSNLAFKFGDANKEEPDLIFNNFGFEITSSRFSDNSQNFDPSGKLFYAFRKKNGKAYIGNRTALLIDITNVSQRAFGRPVSMSLQQFEETICGESKFGAVVFLSEWINSNTLDVTLKVSEHIFSNDCDPELKSMILSLFFRDDNTKGCNMFLSDIK
jgi:hypothetical protein